MSDVTWISPADVAAGLGVIIATGNDGDWLAVCTDAANTVAFRRRAEAGYVDDSYRTPGADVSLGTTLYAMALYRERGSVDSYASFSELGSFVPSGASWGQIQRLWGVMRMAVG